MFKWITPFIAALVTYLTGCFAQASFNIFDWNPAFRILIGFAMGIFVLTPLLASLVTVEDFKND